MSSRVLPGPAAPVDRDDFSRMTPHGRLPDGTFGDRMAMFVSRAIDGRRGVAAVFTHEMHDLGSMERASLAVRVTMPATAQARVKNTKEDVHDIPCFCDPLTVVQSARLQPAVDGQDYRNTLAVLFLHFRPGRTGPCVKVCLHDPKSFLLLSSLVTPAGNYRVVGDCAPHLRNYSSYPAAWWLTFVESHSSRRRVAF